MDKFKKCLSEYIVSVYRPEMPNVRPPLDKKIKSL